MGDESAVQEASQAGGSPGILKLVTDGLISWFKTKKAKAAIVGFLCITGGLYGLFSFQAASIPVQNLADVIAGGGGGGGGGDGKDPFAKFKDEAGLAPLSGTTQEGATSTESLEIGDQNIYEVTFTLTWTDEPDSARHTNQPDDFKLEVFSPDNRAASGSGSNTQGGDGSIVVTLTRNMTKEVMSNKSMKKKTEDMTWSGNWAINVTLNNAGDQEAMFSIFGLRDQPDNGNAWTLDIEWKFKAEQK